MVAGSEQVSQVLVSSAPPTADFLAQHASILVFLAAVVGALVFALVLWSALRPSRHSEEKLTTYECGEDPVGGAWVQFNIRFYVFALIFVVFDVEAVVFIAILVVALAYVWRKGDLAWVRPEDRA